MSRFTTSLFILLLNLSIGLSQQESDFIRKLQFESAESGNSTWGYWGDRPSKYSSWTYHSNRLVPIYTFGINLDRYINENSSYRSEEILTDIYGAMPRETLDPKATYMDQTEVYYLQRDAIAAGKKNIVLIVFDGMDWQTSHAAAIYKNKSVEYESGYGKGLSFLDYDKCKVRGQGDFVCSPHNSGTQTDVDAQTVSNIGGDKKGGYSAAYGGYHSWSQAKSASYLLGKQRDLNHVVTDSAASATSMNCGFKTFNAAINVAPDGTQCIPFAREIQKQGYKIGVVTSVPISHATPACAYANNVNRNDYQDLSRDMVGLPSIANRDALAGVDVLIGCGWGEDKNDDRKKQGQNYVPGNKYLPESDLKKIDVENGGKYVIAQRTSGQKGSHILSQSASKAAKQGHRLFGFFGHAGGHLPYQTADGNFNPTRGDRDADKYTADDIFENPTLAEMTKAALEVLENNEKGFWLMIEAGDVDWANHNNNIDDSIGAVFSGESAFEAVTEWIENNSNWEESAVIVTADHGHFLVVTDPEALTGRSTETEVEGNAVGK